MGVNWQEPGASDRLLAAIIASVGGTINCKEVARLFGGEATYNSIENHLRKPKKLAQELVAQAGGRAAPAPSTPRTPRKQPTTPSKNGVLSGRVTKKKSASASPVKKELVDDSVNASSYGSGADADVDVEDNIF
ncbi:hypothetical protein P154DRAFT_519249 [Amniculicola lignicola CBS 123094]|uniref:Uncharacterized protein n=1 Tax=Amniculicola lignicola CBS 123094 TaxID=1392246 RepID=A0A6A5WUH1_9PLEO|nr:hypothetical protein P154DRAFT_519249 [Amniculicola lignicola CBS 123094]